MSPESTPEEKLLRLIRRKGRRRSEPREAAAKKEPPPKPLKKKSKLGFKEYVSFQTANKILIGFLIAMLVYAGYLILPKSYSLEVTVENQVPEPITREKEEFITDQDLAAYLKDIQKRNLFRAALKTASPGQMQLGLNEMAKDLVLMGVVAGDVPQAIIEDKKVKKVYFLNEGDFLGQLEVQKIFKNKVTLFYNGETLDLFL